MALSNDLISQFVKATRDDNKSSNEVTTYGEIKVDNNGTKYVKLDGSDEYIPLSNEQMTVSVLDKDRVSVTIKNHTLCVTGNLTNHSASAKSVDDANGKISEFDRLLANTVSVEQLAAERARIDALVTENLIVNEELEATSATILELKAVDANISGKLTAAEGDISKLKTDKLDSNTANITYAKIKDLEAAEADIYNLTATYGEFVELTTENFSAVNGDIENLKTDKLDAHTASITYATIVDLQATNGSINILESDVADINTLMFGSATGNVLQTSFANAVIAQLGNAQIKSAMIESIAASKITSGDIITNNVRVKSTDGSLLISDETMQISDGTRVRVQIGKDASNDYSINIWDADGKLMFSEGGISDSAIKQAIIRNDMVSDTANIAAHKLDIDSLFEEINGSTNTIKSTKVYLDDKKQTLDVAFASLSSSVTDLGATVSSQGTAISAIQGQISTKIWQQDINTASDAMNTKYSTLEQSLNGFKTSVSSTVATLSETLSVSGRNLIVRRDELKDTYVQGNGIVTDAEASYRSATMSYPIRIEGGETYAFSKSSSASSLFFRWAWYDSDMKVIGRTASDEQTFTWTAPANAAYVLVSYPYSDGSNAKMEKGDVATKYCPAIEDVGDGLDAVASRFDEYSTTSEMNAAIDLSADGIMSSVSKTYASKTELTNLEIGGRNLIRNGNFAYGIERWVPVGITYSIEEDSTHGSCLKFTSSEIGSSNHRIYPSTTENFIHTGRMYALSFYAKSDANTTIQTNAAGGTAGSKNYELTTQWKRFTHYYTASSGSLTFWPNEAGTTIYLTKVKIEHGNKVTDWTPAPEDVDYEITSLDTRVGYTESSITQHSNSIVSNVTEITNLGKRATTLEQTASGLTARLTTAEGDILDAAKTATNYLSLSTSGLVVGDLTKSTLGKNVLIDSDSVDIRNGTTTLASFEAEAIYLGRHSRNAKIDLCNGLATLYHESKYSYDTLFVIDVGSSTEIKGLINPLCLTSDDDLDKVSIQFANANGVMGGVGIVGSWLRRFGKNMYDTYTILDSGNFHDVMDSGWFYTGGYGEKFTQYNNEAHSKVRYRKVGRMVELRGAMKPVTTIIGSTTQYELFTLPEGYRPDCYIYQRCQGSGVYAWLLTISTSGLVTFSRYGDGDSYVDATTSTWLPFQITFLTN